MLSHVKFFFVYIYFLLFFAAASFAKAVSDEREDKQKENECDNYEDDCLAWFRIYDAGVF